MRVRNLLLSVIILVIIAFTFSQTFINWTNNNAPNGGDHNVPFEYEIIDSDVSGDCKMIGDIDGDGFSDIVIAGHKMYWYASPNWTKTLIANCNKEFTTDGELGDVDDDGDLDVIVPDGPETDNLLWFENPRPGGNPATDSWVRHVIGTIGGWGKDIELNDFDGDGRLDVATRSPQNAFIFFQNGTNTWNKVPIYHIGDGEGMGSGDVDGDGDIDLVCPGYWLENPKPEGDPSQDTWPKHDIDSLYNTIKALVADIDNDGRSEVLFSNSEGSGEVRWYEASDPENDLWTRHDIDYLNKSHTLQAYDMDLDGDIDVVASEMFENVIIYYNEEGGLEWYKRVLVPGGLHNGVVGDIDNDGDFDIVGAMYIGHPPVKMWKNKLDPH